MFGGVEQGPDPNSNGTEIRNLEKRIEHLEGYIKDIIVVVNGLVKAENERN
jgi:hypothetical protein